MTDTYKLDPYIRVAGDTTSVVFNITSSYNVDLRGWKVVYRVSNPRRIQDSAIEKDNLTLGGVEVRDGNSIEVKFNCLDTQNLAGNYLQQIDIYGVDENDIDRHYVLAQGQLKIRNEVGGL